MNWRDRKIIQSLKTNNARGYNKIWIKTLKCSAPSISSPLTYNFNKSLELGSFPSRLNTQQWYQFSKPETNLICPTSDEYLY